MSGRGGRFLAAAAVTVGAWVFDAAPTAAQSASCGDDAWSSIGVAAFHCPGGACRFEVGADGPAFRFTTEPWLRAIDETGPAAGRIQEGDVLVAVEGWLVTSLRGGHTLANLPPRGGRLTLRRGDQLVETDIVPAAACDAPLIVVGNRLPVGNAGGRRSGSRQDERLDYTAPRKVGPSALDLSLGLGLRCSRCTLSLEDGARWLVDDPPVVELVERGGVAEEAGLRAGDRIVAIDGHDVRSRRGGELLHAMPSGDFEITYERAGVRHAALINRRIVDRRIIVTRDPVVRVRDGRGRGGLLGSLARWWRGLFDGEPSTASTAPDRVVARGESWGPARLGALLGAEDGRLFEIDGSGRVRLRNRPLVTQVRDGGAADRAGLRAGDLITHIEDHDIRSARGAELLLRAPAGRPLALRYLRDGTEHQTRWIPEEQ